jgi:SAM-dependent methyltransferase
MDSQELVFDSWAAYYDATDPDRTPFIEFYGSLITDGTRSLLELACGTGAITVPLARRLSECSVHPEGTRRVVGIDTSPAMLRIARERDEQIEWILGDMRSPPVEGPFDLVFCCFNTLQLLLTDDDLAQAFRAVRGLLGSDGIFAFDIYRPNLESPGRGHTNCLARAGTDEKGRHLEIREDTRYEPASRVLTIHWRLVEEGKSDATPITRTRYQIRQYFPAEITELLTAGGLAIRERYGDLDRTPFTPASKKQVIVCGPG